MSQSKGHSREAPMLFFTSGAMGVGKTFVLNWMKEEGILPMDEFVYINPDDIAQQLPEWEGYYKHRPSSAAMMTRLEAGLLTELSLVVAIQHRRNILVDSSLRHGSWYARLLERLGEDSPDVRLMLMYVHTHEETIRERAAERGGQGGSQTAQGKMPRAVGRLLPHIDFFAQVANDWDTPRVTSLCGNEQDLRNKRAPSSDEEEEKDEYCTVISPDSKRFCSQDLGWDEVGNVLQLARGADLANKYTTEPYPLLLLLRTMAFAASKHQGQFRKDALKTPYISHPLRVALILAEAGIRDLATLQAALLHDTLEDTATTYAELTASFGSEVSQLVESLTDDDSLRPVTRKLAQLRGATTLHYKAKLVRIADKSHNVWDIFHNGIPGWTKERTEQYIAWACELVNALEGTHEALEKQFHDKVSLPAGYTLGDWERLAAEKHEDDFDDLLSLQPDPQASSKDLTEHKGTFSLLLAAEFLAKHIRHDGATITELFNVAFLLAFHGIRDQETLQAALLQGAANDEHLLSIVKERFGPQVVRIVTGVAEISRAIEPEDMAKLQQSEHSPRNANLIVLANLLCTLRNMQGEGLPEGEAELEKFQRRVAKAKKVHESLAG
eukprot:CAMPEP_0170650942 /NCGR_PEP_ID=MMETSP0224-20130122/46081_1 /TAXON_ID=285029 /ORGANISM="Togula jolla, Strain CCCM 725" /LENGTH=610 /DNA_ID=CAMNT_0010982657 /DNA_START=1 /DNA_END=1832 /DNA_ORIENTATION=+